MTFHAAVLVLEATIALGLILWGRLLWRTHRAMRELVFCQTQREEAHGLVVEAHRQVMEAHDREVEAFMTLQAAFMDVVGEEE